MIKINHPIVIWFFAYLIPLLWVLFLQVPFCYWDKLSEFLRGLQTIHALYGLSVIFILPAYGVLLYRTNNWRMRFIRWGIFTATLVAYIPILWIFGFNTSRWLFVGCI